MASAPNGPNAPDDFRRMGLSLLPYRVLIRGPRFSRRARVSQELYESGSPQASRLLHHALMDRDESTRLFAAQAMELISTKHLEKIAALRAAVRMAAGNEPVLRAELSEALRRYADECVPAARVRQHLYQEALEHLAAALAAQPDSPELQFRAGRLEFLLGNYQAVRWRLAAVPAEHPAYVEARWLTAEIALREGRVADVRAECRRLGARNLPADLRRAVDFWGEVS